MLPDGTLQTDVIKRKNVRPEQIENQEHFGSPATNAAHIAQCRDDTLIVHGLPLCRIESAGLEMSREIDKVLDLAPGQSAIGQPVAARRQNRLRRHSVDALDKAPPDRIRSADGNLLPDDRARQRHEGLPARFEPDTGIARHQLRHDGIVGGKALSGFHPEMWDHRRIMTQTDITAVILAGGLATRLGGVDKGLQPLGGKPLVQHVLERLSPQAGRILINCNRNTEIYASFGQPLVADRFSGFPGPLAGLQAAMSVAETPLLMTVPCDSPYLPTDLASRLLAALGDGQAAIASSGCREPVFALYRVSLLPRLTDFLKCGERKVGLWQSSLDCRVADFSATPESFRNLNAPTDWPVGDDQP